MARQDLENFKYIYFWQTDVALDSTQKQCWGQLPTAITGEQIDLSCRVHSIVALLLCAIKGKSKSRFRRLFLNLRL